MRVPVVLSALVVAAVGVAAVGALSAQQNPFVGRWNITGTGPDARGVYFLEVKQVGDHLEGMFLNRGGHATPVAWIKVVDGELQWQYGGNAETLPKPSCGPLYRAKLEGGKLIGSHETPGVPCPQPPRPAGAARQPRPRLGPSRRRRPSTGSASASPCSRPPTPTARTPSARPSSSSVPAWARKSGPGSATTQGRRASTAGRSTNGVMTNGVPERGERSTCNPHTKEKFKDFKFQAEFNLGAGQNSGFYLRGRYELQLMLQGADGRVPSYPGLLMDIYGWKRADVYAGNPPDQWQILEGVIVGNRLTATLNGKKVHDNALLPAVTGGAMDGDELAPGPIMIQGDHSKVSFRKLVITPITKPGT